MRNTRRKHWRFAFGALALLVALAHTPWLHAQTPRVTSARLMPLESDDGTLVDTSSRLLIVRIGGLPDSSLRALNRTDILITDMAGRRYLPEGWATGAPSHSGEATADDRRWLFRVPATAVAFELRLPGYEPVRFVGTDGTPSRSPRTTFHPRRIL